MKLLLLLTLASSSAFAASQAGSQVLKFSQPAKNWESQSLPIGNGSIGANLFGGIDDAKIQFTVDSMWTGGENPSGSYDVNKFGAFQAFGTLHFTQNTPSETKPSNYSRSLNIANSQHTTSWTQNGVHYSRETIASHPDKVIAWKISGDKPGSVSGKFSFTGAHKDSDTFRANRDTIELSGKLSNNQLDYDARAKIIPTGGSLSTDGATVSVKQADSVLVLLAADTNYVLDLKKNWMDGKASKRTTSEISKASKLSWEQLQKRHLADYQKLYKRVEINLGSSTPEVSNKDINLRIQNYRDKAQNLPRPCLDPELEALMFNYGRYLLISSSRVGTLPANLQGIWNNTNNPPWRGDYHTNINLQMNYWLAETTNLPELAKPLFAMYTEQTPVFRKHTIKEYGDTTGFVTRMSTNPFGGGGWNWNIEGTAWIAQHYFEHYKFSGDKEFLKKQAYPWLRDVSRFWIPRLKKLPSGKLVVPNAWSHEHGPHEDGTAHAQQLMWDLFSNTLSAAKTLGVDRKFQKELNDTIAQLYGPKIGSWGQLMEWMEEKSLEKSNHRHTSHLYAIFPGVQIGKNRDPELNKAAIVSLTKRGEVGDSRRSWTWAWRTALWARLGDAERAHGCVAGLLAYNTLDNLWTTHPPFQIDGNFGITAGIAECLLQSHEGEISLLPSLPKAWPTGSVKGLRSRYSSLVDIEWKDGKLTKATIHTPSGKIPKIRIQGDQSDAKTDSRISVQAIK